MAFVLQGPGHCASPFAGAGMSASFFSFTEILLRALSNGFRCGPLFWRSKPYSRPARLGQTNGDCLLRRARSMLSFAHMVNLFPHELTRLARWRLALPLRPARSF